MRTQSLFLAAIVCGIIHAANIVLCASEMPWIVVPGGKRTDGEWLGGAFAGKHFVQFIALDQNERPRPEIAQAWVKHLTTAIREKDQRHLLTVGLVDWSLDRPGLTSGFVPAKIADDIDFLCVHLYPEKGKLDKAFETLAGFSVGKPVVIEGTYPHHLQGICADKEAIYWSFTTTLVKTDLSGKLLKKVPVANHQGDLCYHDGKLYVAVNLGKFNDPKGNADSWVYVYDAATLKELARHEVQEVFHGAGGIGIRNGHFFVVGGLPDGVEENYVYEYDAKFKFQKKHVIKSAHTYLGIQTATFAHDRWWFGCYGDPKILLVTDADFQMKGRFEFDCSLGIVGLPDSRFLSATGQCEKDKGCMGSVRIAVPDEKNGLKFLGRGDLQRPALRPGKPLRGHAEQG
jgi:hypothetical protein